MSNVVLPFTAEENPLTLSNIDKAVLRDMDARLRARVLKNLATYLYLKVCYNQLF